MTPRRLRPRLICVSLIYLWLLLAACQPPAATATPAAAPQGTATQLPAATETPLPASRLGVPEEALVGLTIDVWYPWFDEPAASLFESQVEEFNRANHWGVLVRAESLQNYAELYEQASAAVHGPNRPDVVIGLPEYAVEWHAQEAVVDLTPYVTDPLYGLGAAGISDFPSAFWEQDQLGEIRLGVPAQRTTRVLLYNQTWAAELGFESPPANADEFERQACAGNQAMRADADPQNDGAGGWLVDTHWATGLSWLLAFGGGAQEAQGFRFLTQPNIAALQFVKGLAEKNCAWQGQGEYPLQEFVERRALFAVAALEDLPDLARAFAAAGSRDDWTVLPFPGPEGDALVVYGSSYILFESDEATQLAAWLFVRFLLEPDNQAGWVNTAGLFPLQASTMGLLADYQAGHPQWGQAVNLLPQGRPTPGLAGWRTMRVALGDGFAFMFRVDTPVGRVPEILAQLDAVATDLNE
ncbi:MAG: extracellular solute-binding protein [Chloroflexota bacterium]